MHDFGNLSHTQSIIANIVLTEYFWKFKWKIALCGNVLFLCCWNQSNFLLLNVCSMLAVGNFPEWPLCSGDLWRLEVIGAYIPLSWFFDEDEFSWECKRDHKVAIPVAEIIFRRNYSNNIPSIMVPPLLYLSSILYHCSQG